MKTRFFTLTCLAAVAGALLAVPSQAQILTLPNYVLETVATGLSQPTGMVFVNENTLLVGQKANGQVRLVVNGVVQAAPVLDLGVNSDSERGLLGMCLHPDFATNGFVYLYYTRSSTGGDSIIQAEWTDNRVERYVFNGTTLAFDSTITVFAADATQGNGPNHDGGIIMIGPDQKLYIITGDLNRSRAEQNNLAQASNSSSVGGIHRLNVDGSIPSDNPFSAPFNQYHAYGIRNSFGMTFDPVTGYVWFTENGPTSYDEVNAIPTPGMNSGWTKLMGPDARDPQGVGDLVMFTGAYYRDPVFSWFAPIAVTSIAFLSSNKFASQLNNVVIGDSNFGQLYLFTPNVARDGFVLSGDLTDFVADTTTERNLNRIGTGFSTTADLEIGPNGYLYGVSLGLGRVWRIVPKVEEVTPTSLSMFRGSVLSGVVGDLATSNDVKVVARPGAVLTSAEAPVQMILETTNPSILALSQFSFSVESSASASSIQQEISLFNFTTGLYEVMSTGLLTGTDATVTVNVTVNMPQYIEAGTKTMRARIACRATTPVLVFPWQVRVDKAVWSITRPG